MCYRGITVGVGVLVLSACQQPLAPTHAGNVTSAETTIMVRHEQPVPFAGVVTGEASFDFAANPRGCPSGFTTITRARGTVVHLGSTEWYSDHCVSMETGAIAGGRLVLTAANGDEVHATYSGLSGPIPEEIGQMIAVSGVIVITGGTGRFEGASGTAELTASVAFEGFDDPAWSGRWEWKGTITY